MQPEPGKAERKCAECGGTVAYAPGTDTLTCPYCGSVQVIPVDEIQVEGAEELDFEAAEDKESRDWGTETKTVRCTSCGAESVYDTLQISDVCPYCGANHLVVEEKETMAPGGVIPFAVSQQQAGEKFLHWVKRKWFCPKEAKQNARAEKFHGVYLPYWTFDAETYTRYTARYGNYRTERDSKGNERTVIDWYPTRGEYSREVDDHLVCATGRQSIDMLRRIEPFSLKENRQYDAAYLAGFSAERYSVGLTEGWAVAKREVGSILDAEIEAKVRRDHMADTADSVRRNTVFSKVKYKYLLLPLWMSSFRYRDKVYNFLVNGQTGKVGGKYPLSPVRVALAVLAGLAVAALLFYYLSMEG